MALLVSNLPFVEGDPTAQLATFLGLDPQALTAVHLVRKSLDARARNPTWRANWRVDVPDEAAVLKRKLPGVRLFTARDEQKRTGDTPAVRRANWARRPIVVGAGPAGLFAALRLAEAGAPVLLLERGGPVEQRIPAVNGFWRGQALDPDNNILFGEGGAGTFSDGKIYTRRRDGELGYVFRVFIECGADPQIMHEAYAHLGTDRIRAILPALRDRLTGLGVEIRFNTTVAAFLTENGACVGVRTSTGEVLSGGPVIVGAGHSARDTTRAMLDAGARAEVRPIAIGARIEHPQSLIDETRYGAGRGELPASSYRLTYSPKEGRAAWTFCMCPGGMVVPAQHEPGTVVVNGMSFAARRAMWANSALIVQVDARDYGATDAQAGLRFQEAIERKAFALTGGYGAPAQRVDDFLQDRASTALPRTSYPMGVHPVPLQELLPAGVVAGMKAALRAFDKDIKGFAGERGVLIAPETRTTAPIRFDRGDDLQSPTLRGLIPIGEGAGYAGGIVSAALDGFRSAEAVIAAVD